MHRDQEKTKRDPGADQAHGEIALPPRSVASGLTDSGTEHTPIVARDVPARNSRIRSWIRRYLPCEIASTVAEFTAAYLVYVITASLAAAAAAAAISQFVGYYAVAYVAAVRWIWRARSAASRTRTAFLALRSVLVEFGTAELVDSTIVRPTAFYLLPMALGHVMIGWIVAKIVSDTIFYAGAIYSRARFPHLVAAPQDTRVGPNVPP